MAGYKKHHFLPQMYLRAFVDPDRVRIGQHDLWVYRVGEPPRPRGPQGVAVEPHFYATNEIPDSVAVEKMLAVVESRAALHLEKLRSGDINLTPQEKAEFASFVGLQLTRTPMARERSNALAIGLIRQGWKKTLDEGKLGDLVAKGEAMTGKKIAADLDAVEELGRKIADGSMEMVQESKGWSMKNMAEQSQRFGDLFERMHWALLEAPISDPFITSDNPVNVGDPTARARGPKGFTVSDQFRFTFPLSPTFMLYGDFARRPDERAMVTPADVQQARTVHITQAFKEVYASFKSEDLRAAVDREFGGRPPVAWSLPPGMLD